MPFAEHSPTDLEVVLRKHNPTLHAREASRMEFLLAACGRSRLKILPFDARVAGLTQASVRLVIVLLAVRRVIYDIEVCGSKGLSAGHANEARFMPAASESAVGSLDRFACYGCVATTTSGLDIGGAARRRAWAYGILRDRRWWEDALRCARWRLSARSTRLQWRQNARGVEWPDLRSRRESFVGRYCAWRWCCLCLFLWWGLRRRRSVWIVVISHR